MARLLYLVHSGAHPHIILAGYSLAKWELREIARRMEALIYPLLWKGGDVYQVEQHSKEGLFLHSVGIMIMRLPSVKREENVEDLGVVDSRMKLEQILGLVPQNSSFLSPPSLRMRVKKRTRRLVVQYGKRRGEGAP